jgi:hypothetical protein
MYEALVWIEPQYWTPSKWKIPRIHETGDKACEMIHALPINYCTNYPIETTEQMSIHVFPLTDAVCFQD